MTQSRPEVRRPWQTVTLILTGAIVVALNFGAWKPIWFDELLHFAFGGMTFEEALKTIDYTTIEVNHGQTGVYMLLDWALLHVFGANTVALRLPSILAGILLLAAAVTFIRVKGLSFAWQLLVLIALAGHTYLMWFLGDARPYMPLAASTIAMLAYYAHDPEARRRWLPRLYGVLGVFVGALFHPYWIYLVALVLVFSAFNAWFQGALSFKPRALVQFASPWLLGASLIAFVIIGQLTWMRRLAEFGYDPFEAMGGVDAALQAFWNNHIANSQTPTAAFALLGVITVAALAGARFRSARGLLPPAILILLALLSSVAISALSAARTYWVLDRQWVAGIALQAIALVWFFGTLSRTARAQADRSTKVWLAVPAWLFGALTIISAALGVQAQVSAMNDQRLAAQAFIADRRSPQDILAASDIPEPVVYATNVNVARGGDVWQEFVYWYNTQAGMRPDFRPTNPSWTRLIFSTENIREGATTSPTPGS